MFIRTTLLTFLLGVFHSIQLFSQSCDIEFEGFENGGGFPPGWTTAGCYTNGTTAPNTGTYHAGFNTENDALISSTYSCPNQICYYWRTSGTSSDFSIDVQWSDNGGSTWNTIRSFSVQDSSSITTYRQNCIDLSGITFSDPTNVSFQFLQYNRVVGSWYLDDVCISSGGASELIFSSVPSGCTLINTNFSTEVCATDNCGNIDNTFSGNISVSKNTGSGNLSGTTSQVAVNGCATFNDLQFDASGNYTLSAASAGLNSATSLSFELKSTCPNVDTLTIVHYNTLNFPNTGADQLGGCSNYLSNREDTLKKIMKYINPDVLMICELQNSVGADLILNNVLNTNGVTKYAKANFVVNTSSGDNTHNNMFYYNSDKINLYSQGEIKTDLRDVNEYIVYGNDPNLGTTNDTTFIDFYEAHLKAGSASTDSLRRNQEADSIRKYIDLKPVGHNNILGGDFNVYTDQEQSYQRLCYSGTYPFNDPISREGAWNNNSAFADVHSQATRAGAPDYDCGSFGGVDDRFDFLFVSDNILSGADRVGFVPGSYSSLGNNGSVFNGSINDLSNTSGVPDSVLRALFYMSDHLPVVMKVAIEYPTPILSIETEEHNQKNHIPLNITDYKIYPNPSSGSIVVSSKVSDEKPLQFEIYNLVGSKIYSQELLVRKQEIDLSDLPKGVYICNILSPVKLHHQQRLIIY